MISVALITCVQVSHSPMPPSWQFRVCNFNRHLKRVVLIEMLDEKLVSRATTSPTIIFIYLLSSLWIIFISDNNKKQQQLNGNWNKRKTRKECKTKKHPITWQRCSAAWKSHLKLDRRWWWCQNKVHSLDRPKLMWRLSGSEAVWKSQEGGRDGKEMRSEIGWWSQD